MELFLPNATYKNQCLKIRIWNKITVSLIFFLRGNETFPLTYSKQTWQN